jgi:ribulose-5-phosphate 4-epimerase/fuculose-1-phosphate aldolase
MLAGDPEAVGDLVDANHILARRGLLDGFGHVSARDGEHFLIARNLAPARVGTADVMRVAFDGTVSADDARKPYLERFIHGAIYAARPDVGAIVHSHAASVIPFSIARGASLCAVSHMGGFLGAGIPLFEIRDAAGEDNDMLVRDAALGTALARSLGDAAAVLMRGHGITVVGVDVRQAVFRAIYTEVNARLQSEALRLGPLVPLNAHEARRASAANDSQIERAWELWKSER